MRALRACTPRRCTLHPGETLLLPAYWHHEVYSHASEGGADADLRGDLNVAVNFWFRNTTAPPASYE